MIAESADTSPETLILTPEKISNLTGRPQEEVEADLRDVELREFLIASLQNNEHVRGHFEDVDSLRSHLDLVHKTLEQKRSFFQKTGDALMWTGKKIGQVLTYPIRHPFRTAMIAALGFAAVGAGFYMAGEWELFLTSTGLDKVAGYLGATGELVPPVAPTDIVPGAGEAGVGGVGPAV